MAVLRATRFYAAQLGATKRPGVAPLPADPRADAILYTVPSGRKAILRSATANLIGPLPTGNPYYHLKILHVGDSSPTVIHFCWFFDPNTDPRFYLFTNIWNGQVVLNAGEKLLCYNGSNIGLHVTGSGAELPINSSALE